MEEAVVVEVVGAEVVAADAQQPLAGEARSRRQTSDSRTHTSSC